MTGILSEIISLLVSGITGIASGIGQGLSALVTNIFLSGTGTTADPYTLTTFGGVVIIFAGLSLAIGLSRLIVHWITSLGASNV